MAGSFAYIEAFYNPLRPHSSIGWHAPNNFSHLMQLRRASVRYPTFDSVPSDFLLSIFMGRAHY